MRVSTPRVEGGGVEYVFGNDCIKAHPVQLHRVCSGPVGTEQLHVPFSVLA
jgi:hypothetical protein